ncbi:unnamed protein product [Boreogadus saida]
MPSGGAIQDIDADFVYDYETLRIGGLTLAGIMVLMSVFLLFGNKIRNCGKSKAKPVEED